MIKRLFTLYSSIKISFSDTSTNCSYAVVGGTKRSQLSYPPTSPNDRRASSASSRLGGVFYCGTPTPWAWLLRVGLYAGRGFLSARFSLVLVATATSLTCLLGALYANREVRIIGLILSKVVNLYIYIYNSA